MRTRVFLFLLSLIVPAFANAAPVPIAGTRVSLEPPPGFVKADQFPGFIQKSTQASILVSDIPAPFAEVTKGFNTAGLASRKMTLVQKESVTLPAGEALLLSVRQEAQGIRFAKWMLVFGDPARTTLVVATYPEKSDAALGDALRQSLLGVTLSAGSPSPAEGLTFTVTEQAPLRILHRVGNSVVLGTDEKFPAGPALVVAASVSEDVQIANRRAHARQRLRQNEHVAQIDLLTEEQVQIDALPGVALVAEGRDRQTGTKLFLLQTTLYNEEGYYVAQGLAPAEQRATYEPLFQSVIASFRRKR